jgi:predicted nucleic acid-binding protein
MNYESIDTNVLLRLTIKDLPDQYEQAKKLVLERKNTKLLVADVALIEYVFALMTHYQKNRRQIAEMVSYVIALPQIQCSKAIFGEACDLYLSHPKLSFEDCYLAAYAGSKEAIPLWTFDRKLALQADTAKLVK